MLLGYPLAYHFENDSIVFSDGFYDNIITKKFLNVAGFVIRNSMLGFLIIWLQLMTAKQKRRRNPIGRVMLNKESLESMPSKN